MLLTTVAVGAIELPLEGDIILSMSLQEAMLQDSTKGIYTLKSNNTNVGEAILLINRTNDPFWHLKSKNKTYSFITKK